jgi:hypothetical protein
VIKRDVEENEILTELNEDSIKYIEYISQQIAVKIVCNNDKNYILYRE